VLSDVARVDVGAGEHDQYRLRLSTGAAKKCLSCRMMAGVARPSAPADNPPAGADTVIKEAFACPWQKIRVQRAEVYRRRSANLRWLAAAVRQLRNELWSFNSPAPFNGPCWPIPRDTAAPMLSDPAR